MFDAKALGKLPESEFVLFGTENKLAIVFVFVVWAGTIVTFVLTFVFVSFFESVVD